LAQAVWAQTIRYMFDSCLPSRLSITHVAKMECVAEYFVYDTGYDEGFASRVKVSRATLADYERLLEQAKAGLQESLGLKYAYLPIVGRQCEQLLKPEGGGQYRVVDESAEYRKSPNYDDLLPGVDSHFLTSPCYTFSGVEVTPGWIQVRVLVEGTRVKMAHYHEAGVREGERSSVVELLQEWGCCSAIDQGPLPPSTLSQDELFALLAGEEAVHTFSFSTVHAGKFETAFVGTHVVETYRRTFSLP